MGGNRELAERFIATLEARDWDAWAGLLHPGVVYEIPQSRERIRGRDRYLRFNQEYPGDWHLRPKVTIADERHGVVWFEWLLDGHPGDAMAFFEFADGLITRVTDFWPEPYEPPPGREHLVERWLPAAPGRSGLGAEPARDARRHFIAVVFCQRISGWSALERVLRFLRGSPMAQDAERAAVPRANDGGNAQGSVVGARTSDS